MALAGHHHVVGPVQHQAHRLAGQVGAQRGVHRPGRGLLLLAAEGAAQPAHVHLDRVHGHAQHPGDDLLHRGRGLGGRVHLQGAVLGGHGQGGLGLQVEMLLAAAVGAPADDVGAVRPRGVEVAAGKRARGRDVVPRAAASRGSSTAGRGSITSSIRARARRARSTLVGQHDGHGLAHAVHLAVGQGRLVQHDGAGLVLPGDVVGGQHRGHALGPQGRGHVQPRDAPVGHRRAQHRGLEAARRRRQVVHEDALAAHVQLPVVGPHTSSPQRTAPGASFSTWAMSRRPASRRL